MFIVLDANGVIPDVHLKSPSFRMLAVRIAEGRIRVGLPRVAVMEIEAYFQRAMDDRLRAFENWLVRTDPLGTWSTPKDLAAELKASAQDYPERLAERLSAIGIEILPLPTVDLESLTRRAALRQPPFASNGNGFRDNLIWQGILDLAGSHDDLFLVSNDRAFQGDDEGLHPFLIAEIAERGFNGQIRLVHKLPELVLNSLLDRELGAGESLETYADEARSELVDSDLVKEWLQEQLYDAVAGLELDEQAVGLPPYTEDASIVGLDIADNITIDSGSIDGGGNLVGRFEVRIDAEIDFVADSADEEEWGFSCSEWLRYGRCRADVTKILDLEGLIAFEEANPVSLEVTKVRAPEGDAGVELWEARRKH
jgi:PIN domain